MNAAVNRRKSFAVIDPWLVRIVTTKPTRELAERAAEAYTERDRKRKARIFYVREVEL